MNTRGLLFVLTCWMDETLAQFRRWISRRCGQKRNCPSYYEYVLEKKLEQSWSDIHYLQYQLAKVRADNTDLQIRRDELAREFADVLGRSDDLLRHTAAYTVRKSRNGASWETVVEQCPVTGCDLDVYDFPAERDALVFAALLEAVGCKLT